MEGHLTTSLILDDNNLRDDISSCHGNFPIKISLFAAANYSPVDIKMAVPSRMYSIVYSMYPNTCWHRLHCIQIYIVTVFNITLDPAHIEYTSLSEYGRRGVARARFRLGSDMAAVVW